MNLFKYWCGPVLLCVQVGMKLLWSSHNQNFHWVCNVSWWINLPLWCVQDFESWPPRTPTSYFLQTLERDFTSDFDVIGPHYTSDCTFVHDVPCRVLINAIHQCGFLTVAVVTDGASANLKMIKEMSGASLEAYGFVQLSTCILTCLKSFH